MFWNKKKQCKCSNKVKLIDKKDSIDINREALRNSFKYHEIYSDGHHMSVFNIIDTADLFRKFLNSNLYNINIVDKIKDEKESNFKLFIPEKETDKFKSLDDKLKDFNKITLLL